MKSMRTAIVTGIMVLVLITLSTEVFSADRAVIRVGVSAQSLPQFNRNDVTSAVKVWAEAVVKERNLEESVEVRILDSFSELQTGLTGEQIDAVSITAQELDRLELTPDAIFFPASGADFHTRYVVVAHRAGGITDLKDLKGHTLSIAQGHSMILAETWLESLLMDQVNSTLTDWFGSVVPSDKASKAVLNAFFRQTDAALLTLDAFNIAGELNPQLHRDLVVLFESPPFIPTFFVFRPSWEGTTRHVLEDAIQNLHLTPAGHQVMIVFQSSRMEKQPGSVLNETLSFLHNYRQQQQRRSVKGEQL